MNKVINVGLCGYGTVGRGVFKLINSLDKKFNIKLLKVLDMPNKKAELGNLLVTDYLDLVNDNNIDIVIECLGGDTLSYKVITGALLNSKIVITSNKETVSNHFDEYIDLAKKHNTAIYFEASVGGGIPLLHNIYEISKFDNIKSFDGILNGTTNFILTKMFYENMNFTGALKLAQEKGFAEKDPSADLKGLDLVRKGHILASLAFNVKLDNTKITHFGIENINSEIVDKIKSENKLLKLVVSGEKIDNKVALFVMPTIINQDDPLASIKYEFNGVNVHCENNDLLTLIGKGAGQLPTASAIMQDLMHAITQKENIDRTKAKEVDIYSEFKGNYLVYKNNKFFKLTCPTYAQLSNYEFVALIKGE